MGWVFREKQQREFTPEMLHELLGSGGLEGLGLTDQYVDPLFLFLDSPAQAAEQAVCGAQALAAGVWIPSAEERVVGLARSAECYHISSNFHFLWAEFQLSFLPPDARVSQTSCSS